MMINCLGVLDAKRGKKNLKKPQPLSSGELGVVGLTFIIL